MPREMANTRFMLTIAQTLSLVALLALSLAAVPAHPHDTALIETETTLDPQGPVGAFASFTEPLIEFQRRANAEIASLMNAVERGDDLGAFFLGLAIAFAYGSVHALGPGHGKFVIVSYFLGREARVMRGVAVAVQVAVFHVIAAVVVVWLADFILQSGFGIGLSEVPGVRAASFLIIVGIGVHMLYRAVQASMTSSADGESGHGHSHGHEHAHGHGHGRGYNHAGSAEGGLIALAAGMVPCPGAVLIMLYAVANDMIYPGFLLVAAMSLGIGLTICSLGVGAILVRQTALKAMERSGGNRGAYIFRHTMNYAGATFVTLVGLVSFLAFLDTPLG